MQASEPSAQDQALEALANGAQPKAKGKRSKGNIAKVEGMAGSLAEKSTTAQNAAIATADRDSLTFAQTYLQRFDANMQAINGKLTQAWQTVGDFDELMEGEELPPFEDQLDQLLAS
jgi:hypothetical protein